MTALRSLTHATRYLDPARMKAWLRCAPVGEGLVYASGASLEGGRNPAAVLAREWIAAGLVNPKQKRAGNGITDYIIEKRAVGAVIHPAARQGGEENLRHAQAGRTEVASSPPTGKELDLYLLLVEAAEAGADCPGHGALAERLDLPRRETARYLFNKLEAAGHVRLIEPARFGARVIEIVATGQRTRSQGDGAGGNK